MRILLWKVDKIFTGEIAKRQRLFRFVFNASWDFVESRKHPHPSSKMIY
jgi:hypothetical protein